MEEVPARWLPPGTWPIRSTYGLLLHELAQEREKGTTWWQLIRDAPRSQATLAKEVLEELLSRRRLDTPTALLKLADRLTGYTAVIANLPGAERREADWRGFRELVRDLERGADDAFTVVRWLHQIYESDAEVPRPPLEAGNAVSLMTVHSAKGLEWPVVVMPDLARGYPSQSHPILFDPEFGVAVNFGEDDGEPVLYRLIADRKLLSREAEARRLFYVACTRARDHLILTSTEGQTKRFCGLTLLQPGLELADISCAPVPIVCARSVPPGGRPASRAAHPLSGTANPVASGANSYNGYSSHLRKIICSRRTLEHSCRLTSETIGSTRRGILRLGSQEPKTSISSLRP